MVRIGSRTSPKAPSARRPAWWQAVARWLLLALAVWLVVAVLYPGPLFDGEIFHSADATNADAFTRVGDAARARGESAHWNPYLFAGMPAFGSQAYLPGIYPPAALFSFLQGRLGMVPLTWMLSHLVFGGMGMVWLLSRWNLPNSSLLLGAALFVLFPQIVAWGVYGHGSKLGVMYLPWIVGWTLRVMDGTGPRAVGMLGLLTGLLLLRAHPQIAYYSLAVTGWLAAWNAVQPFDAAQRALPTARRALRLGQVGAGIGLGFLVGAVLLLPVHDYAGISIRGQGTDGDGGVGLEYASGWSLAPAELGTFVLPAAAGFGRATYLGLMPLNDYPNYYGVLWLALVALAFARGARSLWTALVAISVLAVFVSFGMFGFGLYELLYRVLPFFNKFRVPSMVLVVPAFALALLAARGLVRAGAAPERRPLLVPAVLGAIGLLMLAGGGASLFADAYRDSLAKLAAAAQKPAPPVLLDAAWELHQASLVRIGLILLAAAAALFLAGRREGFRLHGLPWVLAILVCVDLLGVNRLIVHPEAGLLQVGRGVTGQAQLMAAPAMLVAPAVARPTGATPGAATLAAAVGHDRIWPLGEYPQGNTWMVDGIRSLDGYHAAKLASYEAIRKRLYGDPLAGRLASWLSARLIVLEGQLSPDQLTLLGELGCVVDPVPMQAGNVWAYRNRSALPRARLLSRWEPAPAGAGPEELGAFLDAIQAGNIDVARTSRLDRSPDPAPAAVDGPLPIPEFVTDGLDVVTLRTRAATSAVLVLADMSTPGWTVHVDGRPATLMTADLVLRAVAVPAGEHTVTFRYRDDAYRLGRTLTWIGSALVLGLIAWSFFPRRQQNMEGTD